MAISRRNFIAATGSAGLIAGAPSIVRSQTGPIKLGSVLDTSGNLDIYGKPMVMATTLAVEEINAAGGLLGRKVHLELTVKVTADWTRSPDALKRFGYEVEGRRRRA